ncbi:MAG: hypothetical protein EP330_04275 [Deltaproteobacteria bacterium]|nr:MAG: hypothetical protein EP330_04275 [Deltaproteobacteria bacterium]
MSEYPPASMRVVVLLVVLPVLAGALVAGFADGWMLTRWVLVLEPLLWLIACAMGLHLLASGRTAYGTAVLVGWLLFAATLRFPVSPRRPDAEVQLALSQCTDVSSRMRDDLKVISADWSPDLAGTLAPLDADLLVISGIPEPEVGRLAVLLERTAPPHPSGTALFVRGDVQSCAGATTVPLPGGFTALARVGDQPVPVIALDHAQARELEGLAAGARDLASPYTVVLGSTLTHGTFRRAESWLHGVRLASAPHKATWPAQLGTLPFLPLYHADRLWVGPGWRVARIETARVPGAERLALVATLTPKDVAQ